MNTILVVEDDNLIQEVIADILPMGGYQCRLANNGREALDAIADYLPDLILLDLNMPIMDGQTFLQHYIETTTPHVPIVLLASFNHGLRNVADIISDYLPKPFGLVELLNCVRSHLEIAKTGSPPNYHYPAHSPVGGCSSVLHKESPFMQRLRYKAHHNNPPKV